jgi:translation initiation factor 2B subunit (eIF-2B alpha/beta/delta family)
MLGRSKKGLMPIHDLETLIHTIETDASSGSTELINRLIDGLLNLGPLLAPVDKALACEKILTLAAAKPFFAVLTHFALTLSNTNENWDALLEQYKSRFKTLTESIAYQFIQETRPHLKTFLLHSHSSTIVSVFKEIVARQMQPRIFQTTSAPGEEGLLQAQKLDRLSLDVQLVDTNPSPEILAAVDYFVTGADLILEDEFINKTGTKAIAEKIKSLNKFYIVLADPRKLLAIRPSSLPMAFEYVPNNLVTRFITGQNGV